MSSDLTSSIPNADSWSNTEVLSLVHNHAWSIKGFSQSECRYLETSTKVRDLSSAANACASTANSGAGTTVDPPSLIFRIRLHPQGNKESNKDFTFFQCFCNQPPTQFKAKYKFTIYNSRGDEIATTVYTGTQQLHGYFEYIRRDLLVGHVLPQDELRINLELSVTFDTVTRSSQAPRPLGPPSPKTEEVSKDLEVMFNDSKLTDFIIDVGEQEIPTHRVVLSARSPVFAAMLEPHTMEAQKGRVRIDGIEYDVMHELLLYLYSGTSPNLSSMGLDLLSAADRFNLPGLKAMADQVLRTSLTVDSVCRNLVFADMYNSTELRNEAIKFITQNVLAVVHTDGWAQLSRDNPDIVTAIMVHLASERKSGIVQSVVNAPALGEPPVKRARVPRTPPSGTAD